MRGTLNTGRHDEDQDSAKHECMGAAPVWTHGTNHDGNKGEAFLPAVSPGAALVLDMVKVHRAAVSGAEEWLQDHLNT